MEAEVLEAERKLRLAVFAGDVEALGRLLADDVLYVGPDGSTLDKAADLQAYRSGDLRIRRYDSQGEPRIQRVTDDVVLLSITIALSAEFRGTPHEGIYQYTRLYTRRDRRWQIVFAQAVALPS